MPASVEQHERHRQQHEEYGQTAGRAGHDRGARPVRHGLTAGRHPAGKHDRQKHRRAHDSDDAGDHPRPRQDEHQWRHPSPGKDRADAEPDEDHGQPAIHDHDREHRAVAASERGGGGTGAWRCGLQQRLCDRHHAHKQHAHASDQDEHDAEGDETAPAVLEGGGGLNRGGFVHNRRLLHRLRSTGMASFAGHGWRPDDTSVPPLREPFPRVGDLGKAGVGPL